MCVHIYTHILTLTTQSLYPFSVAGWSLENLVEQRVPFACQGQNLGYSGWSSSVNLQLVPTTALVRSTVVRFIGEVNGTLNLFWLPREILWQLLLEASEKDSLLCACFAHWLHIGTEMRIWVWSESPCVLFPFLFHDRCPRLFLFRVIC